MSEKEEKTEEEKLKFIWKERARLGSFESLKPIINALILMAEDEKKKTVAKIDQSKKMLEILRMKQNK